MIKKLIENKYEKYILPILGMIFLFAVLCAGIAIFFYTSYFPGSITCDHQRWGTFGDFFGGVLNPIFSFLALSALLLTIILQRKELIHAIDEFSKTSQALDDQSKSLKIQNFENTFFNLLNTHNQIVNSIDLKNKKQVTIATGRDCFRQFYKILKTKYNNSSKKNIENDKELIVKLYIELFEKQIQSDTGHYFLFLYNIVKYVDSSDIENKYFYTNLVRAQLSYDELALLFYNCISIPEKNKFKPLIEKYHLFKNLPLKILLNEKHKKFYKSGAFDKSKNNDKKLIRQLKQ